MLKLSHDTILYTLYYTILFYTILCYSILFYTILYYSILFYTIYYTIIPLESPNKKSLDVCWWYLQPSSVTPSDDQEVVCGNARDTRGGLRRLVVYKPSEKSSVGMMTLPTEWKNKNHVPNNQPVIYKIYDMNLYKIMTHTYNYYSNKNTID